MRARQDGQALVEFALIAPLLLMLVFGIIYFGIGLNYWLDMNRVANQGARQAAVNHWPTQCPRGEAPSPGCINSSRNNPVRHRSAHELEGAPAGRPALPDTQQCDGDGLLPG